MCKVGQWWQEGAVGCIRPRADRGPPEVSCCRSAGRTRPLPSHLAHHHPHQRQPFNPPGTAQPPPTDCLGAVWVGLSSGRSCAPGGGCALPVLVCLLSLLSWLVVPELLLLTRRAAALPHYNSSTGGTPTPSAPPTTHHGKTQNMSGVDVNCVESVLDDAVIFADRVNTGPGFGSFLRAGAVEGKARTAESLQARILLRQK